MKIQGNEKESYKRKRKEEIEYKETQRGVEGKEKKYLAETKVKRKYKTGQRNHKRVKKEKWKNKTIDQIGKITREATRNNNKNNSKTGKVNNNKDGIHNRGWNRKKKYKKDMDGGRNKSYNPPDGKQTNDREIKAYRKSGMRIVQSGKAGGGTSKNNRHMQQSITTSHRYNIQ